MQPENAINLHWLLLGGFPKGILGGLALNVAIALGAFITSFILGHCLALGRLSKNLPLRYVCTAYIELIRSIPLVIVLFWFYFSIPILLGNTPSPILSGFLALSAYAAAYQAEYIRSGISSVSQGEIDAACCLGLSRTTTLLRIVLSQAHRKMLPTYASYFTSMFKDTSALYILGLVELMQAGLITAERNPGNMLQVYLVVGSLFFIVCYLSTWMARFLERGILLPGQART
ncbi:MAG: amino acid ABC transporter permease [Burkholderiales bacterium]|nr:amino acid ABC transporter permease [Burkholderiales bacterium]